MDMGEHGKSEKRKKLEIVRKESAAVMYFLHWRVGTWVGQECIQVVLSLGD